MNMITTDSFTNRCYLADWEKSSQISRGNYLAELILVDKVPLQAIIKRYNISLQVLWDIRKGRNYSKRTSKFESYELENWILKDDIVCATKDWMDMQEYPFTLEEVKNYLEQKEKVLIQKKQLLNLVKTECEYSYK